MFGLRRTFSGGALAGVALVSLALVASAPAASGDGVASHPFLATAQGRALERVGPQVQGRWIASAPLQRALRIAETRRGAKAVRIAHAVSGEAVSATLAAAWHAKGLTGAGVKVAIIDGGFAGLAQRQAEGDLPANAVTHDLCDGALLSADDHGTAVAEIVHEMAPAAQLHLLCIEDGDDFAAAVEYAKAQGVQVVNHSAGWEGPFRNDGTDRYSQIVASARASGILWVNSAGNEGESHWSGTYNPSGRAHMWANGDFGNTFVWPNGTEICGFLRWDEWPQGVSDFDLGLLLSGSNVLIDSSEEEQGEGGGEPPFEGLCVYQESGHDLMVFWAIRGYSVRTNPRIDFVSWSPPLEYFVAAGSIASPATSPAALAVGALCWESRQLEPYSSQGPTIDGRVKPELVGHDSVSSATYGPFEGCPSGFAGTSASSPEVAGAAALVKQAYPKLSPDGVRDYLLRNARDLGAPGPDSTYGAGELQLPKPPDIVAPSARALASTGRRGKTARLLASVSDDSGAVSVVVYVKRGSATVATIRRAGFVRAAPSKTVATAWAVPAKAANGSYRHCVRVTDRSGNASSLSCATLVLR